MNRIIFCNIWSDYLVSLELKRHILSSKCKNDMDHKRRLFTKPMRMIRGLENVHLSCACLQSTVSTAVPGDASCWEAKSGRLLKVPHTVSTSISLIWVIKPWKDEFTHLYVKTDTSLYDLYCWCKKHMSKRYPNIEFSVWVPQKIRTWMAAAPRK